MYILKRQIILKPGCRHSDEPDCLRKNCVVESTPWWLGPVLAAPGTVVENGVASALGWLGGKRLSVLLRAVR